MKCPNCGSQDAQFVANTTTKGPSFSKGCCGWIVFGPIGMLCSLCGTGSETDEYWICHSCGTKFQAGEYESELDGKIRKIGSLKSEIVALEESLHDKPIDLWGNYVLQKMHIIRQKKSIVNLKNRFWQRRKTLNVCISFTI